MNILIIIFIILIFYQIFLANYNYKIKEGLGTNPNSQPGQSKFDSINIFQEAVNNVNELEKKVLGPTYPYYKNVKTPGQIGMSDRGTLEALGNDVNGLISYVTLLIQGKSNASVTGQPLGNKFFLKTGAKCLDVNTKNERDRYIYVNNVPEGNIPLVSQGLGVNFSEFKGLIPGAISNLNVLNPYTITQAFLAGSVPPCQPLTMETIDVNNNKSSETHYVTLVDIRNMDPCSFGNRKNPITNKPCRQTFQNMSPEQIQLPSDPLAQLYFFSLSALSIYILYKIIEK